MVTEVEAILNSRPLTYISSKDVEEPLTPSHLILGYQVMSLPDHSNVNLDDPDFFESPDSLMHQFKHLATIMKKFWSEWRKEHLTDLRKSHCTLLAKRKTSVGIKNGKVVVVHDDNLSRGQWRLDRIEKVIKGSDRQVRGARIRTRLGDQLCFSCQCSYSIPSTSIANPGATVTRMMFQLLLQLIP